jgi:uncharacterized damage-inducible protein DinB
MTVDDIRTLFAYNSWANRRLLTTARLLAAEDYARDLRSSHDSVRGTLVHILGSHWVWLRRWLGEPSEQIVARCDAVWDPTNFPDVAALEAAHDTLERDQNAFMANLADDQITIRRTFKNFQGKEWHLSLAEQMQHVINHSTYHRGQVVTLLRQLGHVPPGTDYTTYLSA